MTNVNAQEAVPSTPEHDATIAPMTSLALPVMPASTGGDAEAWRGPLRHFHLTGEREALPRSAAVDQVPFLLGALLRPESLLDGWPLFLPDESGDGASITPAPLSSVLQEPIDAAGNELSALADELPRLVRAFDRALEGLNELVALPDLIDEVFDAFAGEFSLSDAARGALDGQLARLKANLPQGGMLLGLGPHTIGLLHAWSLRRERTKRMAAFVEELRGLRGKLTELLQIDDQHSPAGSDAKTIAAHLGSVGGALFDTRVFSKIKPAHRGSKTMDSARRGRIEETLSTLDAWLLGAESVDDIVLVHRDPLPEGWEAIGARVEQADAALQTSGAVFDELVDRMVAVFKAVRIARLEIEGTYETELHDQTLGRFCWQSLTAEEMLVVPTVVALETVDNLQGDAAGAFAELLRSGRPVQVLALSGTTSAPKSGARRLATGFASGLGYQTIAQRSAFVLQTSLARPIHIADGFKEMARTLRASLAVVATPDWEGSWPWLDLLAAHEGRATPCFCYSPDAGETMADRFELSENPQPEFAWPLHIAATLDADGETAELELPFTFADAAGTDQRWLEHLCLLPASAWSDEQVLLADALETAGDEAPLSVPFIWVATEDGELARAAVTRELAFAARDRRQLWRLLQELAGVDNAWADKAAAEARAEAQAQAAADKAVMQAEHEAALTAMRESAADEAMERLAAVLMSLDSGVPMVAASAAPAPAVVAPAAEAATPEELPAEVAAPVEEDDEDDVSFSDPFIDSALCTSCDECIGINPDMFKYNGDKQSEIVDASKGSFKQLVMAAQKCPSRCIHPGEPADGDDSATDELKTIAATFN